MPALAQQASRKMGDSGRSSGSMFGLDAIEKQIARVHGSVRLGAGGVSGGLGLASRSIPGLGLLAGAASVAGIGEMMSSLAGAGVELTNTSRLAGTTAAGLNSMRGAARLMGLSAGTADQAMTGLNHTIQDAVYGKNTDALNLFRQAGIDIGSIARGAKTSEDVLLPVVDVMTRVAKVNPLAAESMARTWQISSGALPMFIKGTEALQANRREIERMYGSMDAYQASSERFTYSTAKLGMASEKLGMTIMNNLEPHLTPLLMSLSTWVQKHDHDIGDAFDHIGHAVASVDWKSVGGLADDAGKYASRAAKGFDELASSWDSLNQKGKFVSDLLNSINDASAGAGKKLGEITRNWAERNFGTEGEQAQRYGRAYGGLPSGAGPVEGMSLPPGGGGRGSPALSAYEKERQARASRDQFIAMGWTPQAAAGIVANLYSESGMDPRAVGDGGQAGGRAQWHNDRRQAIRRHFGKPVESMTGEEQNVAVDWELRNTEKAAGDALRQAKTAADAGSVVSRLYERPAATEAEATNRARSADAFDRRWSGGPARSLQLTLPESQQSSAGNQSVVRVDINHSNVPNGVTMTPSVQGDGAELGGINVRKAMPEAGPMPPWGYLN